MTIPKIVQETLTKFYSDDERELRDIDFAERQARFLKAVENQCTAWDLMDRSDIPHDIRERMIFRALEAISQPIMVMPGARFPFEEED